MKQQRFSADKNSNGVLELMGKLKTVPTKSRLKDRKQIQITDYF